ncbi:MAG: MATE family efflux transporter [Pirellulaceae bacterium]|nr:MATE family efflux transporter [Planctomycetales bacterium]
MPERNLDSEKVSWWARPAGGREVMMVALPLVVSSISWTVMTFVDRIFLKWVSGTAMSAAFAASTLWFAALCLPLGICSYANTFVSQYYGDRQLKRIGPSVWQAAWIAGLSAPFLLAMIPIAPLLFTLSQGDQPLHAAETRYFQILCTGGPALLLAQAFSSFYSGRGLTTIPMVIDAIFALVNLALDFVMIFGHWGLPAMGIDGAGWATVMSLWLKAFTYMLMILNRKHQETYGTRDGIRWDGPLLRRLLFYGGPSGLQMLLDVMGFTAFVLIVARIGPIENEATSMAFSISTLAFMPIWGLGMGAAILVGQRLGEGRDDLAARATWNTLALAIGYMAVISLSYILIPNVFLAGFFAQVDTDPIHQESVRILSIQLLRFVAAYNLLDATLMVFVNAIKGAGDTQFVLLISLIMGVTLAVATWLGVEVLQLGVFGCWMIITAWVWTLGVIFLLRFLQGSWRSMRVIELQPEAT